MLLRSLSPSASALASLLDRSSDALPYAEKLTTRLKEQVLVEQTVVEQRTCLLPVTEHHHHIRPAFGSGRCNAHRIFKIVWPVISEEPIARLPQPGLTALLKNLQVKLRLFVGRFCFHVLCLLVWVPLWLGSSIRDSIASKPAHPPDPIGISNDARRNRQEIRNFFS